MATPSLAWSGVNLYELPDGDYIWGREFALLPAGTMFAASAILHGIIGLNAEPRDGNTCFISSDGPVLIYGTRDTNTEELRVYDEDLLAGFRAMQLQDTQT